MPSKGGRSVAKVLIWGGLFLAAAVAARYGLMENEALAARCATVPGEAWCLLRFWLPQIFVEQRIGWLALACGVLAFVTGRAGLAWTGWLCGLVGMMLYSVDYATVGGLLALLTLLRAKPADGQAQAGDQPGDGLGVGRLA